VPPAQNTPFARLPDVYTAQRTLLFVVAPGARQQSSSSSDSSSGNGGNSWRSRLFNPWAHASAAAMSGATLVASAEELKGEQAAGEQLIDMLAPILGQLSMGSALGYASGYAMRVVGQVAAFAVGSVFMMLQMAAYKGYISVNWHQVSGDVKSGFFDQDGDGDFDVDDMKMLLRKFIEICTYNLPSGAGFTGGLALGLGFTGGAAGKAAMAVGTATAIPRTVAMMGGNQSCDPYLPKKIQQVPVIHIYKKIQLIIFKKDTIRLCFLFPSVSVYFF